MDLNRFNNHPLLSSLSLQDKLLKLSDFRSNPFYAFYCAELQTESQEAITAVCSGFRGERDIAALLEREQTIGASTAYLKFQQKVESDLTALQEEITEQTNEH